MISGMSCWNDHRKTGSDFCATDFCFMIFTKEKISTYVDPYP